jgi:hypothetical protein
LEQPPPVENPLVDVYAVHEANAPVVQGLVVTVNVPSMAEMSALATGAPHMVYVPDGSSQVTWNWGAGTAPSEQVSAVEDALQPTPKTGS